MTVRSHILPKALAIDLRRGASHAIIGSSKHDGVLKTQGGVFRDDLLCRKHEAATSSLDTYGISFLRRAKEAFDAFGADSFFVENPNPDTLSRFAVSIVWREAQSQNSLSLGPCETVVRNHIFSDARLSWPIIVARENFTLDDDRAIEFNTHPYRTKFSGRNAWTFTALGFSFFMISDRRGLAVLSEEFSANRANPVRVVVGHQLNYTNVKTLKPILDRMLKAKKTNEQFLKPKL